MATELEINLGTFNFDASETLNYASLKLIILRGMVWQSWRSSRIKLTQMKIIRKYNLIPIFDFICFPYK